MFVSIVANPWCRNANFCLLFVRPSDFFSLFKVRRHVIGCINHDIVFGFCTILFMTLPYYILLGYGKNFWLTWGSNRGSSDCDPSTLPLDQKANSFFSGVNSSKSLTTHANGGRPGLKRTIKMTSKFSEKQGFSFTNIFPPTISLIPSLHVFYHDRARAQFHQHFLSGNQFM